MWQPSNHIGYPKRLALGFVSVVLVSSFVSGLLLIDYFRSYRANIDLLIISKSIQGALEIETARDAAMLLGSTKGFSYLVNEEVTVSDIQFASTGKGSIALSVVADNPIDARDGAVFVSQELFANIGRYYDIRNNIDMRSIEAPRMKGIILHPVWLVLSGLISGILFAMVFFLILLSFARIAFSFQKKEIAAASEHVFSPQGEKRSHEAEEIMPTFSLDAFVPKKVDAKFFSFESSGIEREKDYAHFNRGPAPTNLPVAIDESEALPDSLFPEAMENTKEDALLYDEKNDERGALVLPDEPMIADASVETLPIDHEPTVEEYKKRLNDLLKGKMPTGRE